MKMGLFKNYKRQAAWTRKQEEFVYEFIAEEMEKGIIRKGLMAKALSECEGNQERADGTYIKLRFQSIKDEYVMFEEFIEGIKKSNKEIRDGIEFHAKSSKSFKAGKINSNYGRHTYYYSEEHYVNYINYAGGSSAIMELSDKGLKKYLGKSFKSFSEFEEFVNQILKK